MQVLAQQVSCITGFLKAEVKFQHGRLCITLFTSKNLSLTDQVIDGSAHSLDATVKTRFNENQLRYIRFS